MPGEGLIIYVTAFLSGAALGIFLQNLKDDSK
nr:MAG TPA_asm: hypothetical protein [Caudoviricetes sp.]